MKSVNLRQARIFEQAINQNKFWYLRIKDHEALDKVLDLINTNEVYQSVWQSIEEYAQKLVNEKCIKQWDEVSKEMRPLGEEANVLNKEKAEWKEKRTKKKENRLNELNKELSDLNSKYQKITDSANEELNRFKEEKLWEHEWWIFFLEDEEYDLVDKLTWRNNYLPITKNKE